jgi:hypothetical protein
LKPVDADADPARVTITQVLTALDDERAAIGSHRVAERRTLSNG